MLKSQRGKNLDSLNKETQKELFERLADQLNDGGYLFIGHSESLNGMTSRFISKALESLIAIFYCS